MSKHHMLPPIIYLPQPKPKKIESRKSRVTLRGAGNVEAAGQSEETEETFGVAPLHPQGDAFAPIEGSGRKPWSTTGRLSEETLQAMLWVQEEK